MNFKLLSVFILSILFLACKNEEATVTKVTGERLAIDSKIDSDPSFVEFIQPYKKHVNETLNTVISYNPSYLSKSDGDLNSALGNLMADAVMKQVSPLFKTQNDKDLDFVLLNHGGIRADLPKGNITPRNAYALMPFENEIVVAELSGRKVREMLKYLSKAKTAHPVSGITLYADRNYNIYKAFVQGKAFDENRNYYVATSDYLQQGGDNMKFFSKPVKLYHTDYKLRNVLIDYFKKTDTVKSQKDDRYTQS